MKTNNATISNNPEHGMSFCIFENETFVPKFKFKTNDELQHNITNKSIFIKGTCNIDNALYYIVCSAPGTHEMWSQNFVEKYFKLKKNDSKTPKFKRGDEIICSYNPHARYKVLDVQYDDVNGHCMYKLLNDGSNFEHIGKTEYFDFEFIDKSFIYKKDYKNLPFLFRQGDLLINKTNKNQRLKILTTYFDEKTKFPMYYVKIIGTENINPKGTQLSLSKESVETFYELFYRA